MDYESLLFNIRDGKYDGNTRKEANDREGAFQTDLYTAFGVTNNPKAGKAYAIAWDLGHAHGYEEVVNYFSDVVELIKP